MNDVSSSSAHAELATTNRYSTPQKYSPSDDNLDVNAKAKSVSMIITNRDAEESMSPAKKSTPVRTSRKSKKSSKKSTRGSDEKKHRSKMSKSKVQDAPVSEAEDTLKPLSLSEAMGASLRSNVSSDRASSPEKQSSFHKIRRFPSTGKIGRRRASNEFNTSSSSAHVMNRLSHPLRSLKSVPSKDSFRGSSQGSSPEYQDDQSESPRRSTLDSTNISDEHDSHAPQKHRKGKKLLSRLVTSPTQLDNCGSISIADDDDEHAVSMGIELALMTGDVPRLCDAKGRCLFHPHIRLQKPKLFGGWKILFKHCPDCAVEHMRATQDKLAEKKKKKRREKKSDEKKNSDPIIEMNVGDDGFTPKKNKKKKKKHRDDGEKKEEPQEPLALPAPVPAPESPREEDYQTDVSDAVTNYDPSYQDSRAIVEHKPPRSKKVNGLPWSDYNGQSGRYTGEVNEQYLPHGRGEMVYDKGLVSAGIWYNGVLDTEEPVSMDGYVPHRLPNYEIGDKGSDEDMIITPKKETAAAVAQIRVNDAAFVRRSDGSWTYAIVKDQVDDGRNRSIRFKVNTRGSTKSFPPSQWGTYIRCVNTRTEVNTNRRSGAQANRSAPGLGEYLDSNNRRPVQPVGHSSNSVAGNFTGYSGDVSVSSTHSAHSAPVLDRSRSTDNLTTAKMRIKSRSRSRGRKNVTTLPLLFSSSMSVSEEAEDDNSAEWETASGSGYRLRGIDP
ncbi:hypothetical protein QTG54_014905 [Skeletonema marinoi]|uniref:Uncharacterized protein n=1 Tax=Skeletonema marinoi TaxID=267567 RepID=A0AAD9D688_9STRA|nr:hypothetical protein QTG54_014905 [Skeletonema marinoi]